MGDGCVAVGEHLAEHVELALFGGVGLGCVDGLWLGGVGGQHLPLAGEEPDGVEVGVGGAH